MSDAPSAQARPDQLTILAFAALVVLGGGNAVAVKLTVAELAPFWGAGLRFVGAGIVMLLLVAALRRPLPRGRSLAGAALYGIVGFSAGMGFAYSGLREVSAGTAMVLIALTPLLTFGLAIIQGQERFHAQGLIGALIALVGIAVIFADQLSANVPILSLLLVLFATVSIAESAVIVKTIPRADPFATNAVAMLTGGGLLVMLALATGEPLGLPRLSETWAAIGYVVLLGSVVAFGLFVFTLRRWTASAVSYSTLLMPLVTVVLAALLTGERVTSSFVIGGAVILSGVYVGAFLKGRPGRSSASSLPECLPIDACAEPEAEPAGA